MENLPPWVLEFRDAPAIAGAGFSSRGCLSLSHHSVGPSQHRPVKLQASTSGFSSNPSDLPAGFPVIPVICQALARVFPMAVEHGHHILRLSVLFFQLSK